MDIKKGYEEIKRIHDDLSFEIDECDDECIVFNTDVVFDRYKGSVFIKCTAYDSGTIHITFTLDQIEETFETLSLINRFNKDEPFLKMYLINHNHKKFLEIHYYSKFSNDDEMVDEYEFAWSRFAEERGVAKQIKYLSEKTYSEEEIKDIEEQRRMN